MNQLNQVKKFSAIHDIFYKEFGLWFNEKSKLTDLKNGVYTLCASELICRALGKDEEGILYIGKGLILDLNKPRIGTLINSLNDTAIYHEAGVRYNKAPYKDIFPLDTLVLKVELFENDREIEQQRLNEYFKKFGEFPPLNRLG